MAEAGAWMEAIELLSLDFARPVFSELGVGIVWEETLRGLARDALLGRVGHRSGLFDTVSMGNADALNSTWRAAFLSVIDRAMGPEDRARVEHWVEHVAFAPTESPWSTYEELLSSWGANFRKTGNDRIGLGSDAGLIARDLKTTFDVREVEALLTKRASRFLTDWDLPRFKRLGLLEIPEGSDFFPFVDGMLLTIHRSRFQVFWRWLVSALSEEYLERVGAAALVQSRAQGVPFASPLELPLPPTPLVPPKIQPLIA
jgi:hypothetical protein